MFRPTLLLCLFGLSLNQASANVITEAIVGGEYATESDFKYQISLQFYGTHYCGGAIIHEKYILTAAHCVTDEHGHVKILPYRVIAGTKYLKDRKKYVVVPVDIVYVHREYNPKNYHNDIAILKLKSELHLSHHAKIDKVHLPHGDSNFAGVSAVVSGFGFQNMKVQKNSYGHWEELGGQSDGKLKRAKVKIISHNKCVKMNDPQAIFKTNICGQIHRGNTHEQAGVCTGDSGSPLVHEGEVIGVVSKSPFACNEINKASTYTRVTDYLDWIHKILNGKPGGDVKVEKLPY